MSRVLQIKGFPEYYVTDTGDVYSRNYKGTGRIKRLKPRNNGKGYLSVCLRRDGKTKQLYIHRLVANAFIPNLDNKPEINHIDGDKQNNNVCNLEFVTHSENQKHRFISLGQKCCWVGKLGEENPFSKIVIQSKCGIVINVYNCSREAAEATGIDASQIRAACRGKVKKSHGYEWKYKTKE